jgi:hypothetical protein
MQRLEQVLAESWDNVVEHRRTLQYALVCQHM